MQTLKLVEWELSVKFAVADNSEALMYMQLWTMTWNFFIISFLCLTSSGPTDNSIYVETVQHHQGRSTYFSHNMLTGQSVILAWKLISGCNNNIV